MHHGLPFYLQEQDNESVSLKVSVLPSIAFSLIIRSIYTRNQNLLIHQIGIWLLYR